MSKTVSLIPSQLSAALTALAIAEAFVFASRGYEDGRVGIVTMDGQKHLYDPKNPPAAPAATAAPKEGTGVSTPVPTEGDPNDNREKSAANPGADDVGAVVASSAAAPAEVVETNTSSLNGEDVSAASGEASASPASADASDPSSSAEKSTPDGGKKAGKK